MASPAERGDRLPTVAAITLRPIGVPLPLGFTALAVASLLVTAQELEWVPASAGVEIGLVLLGFAVPVQLLGATFGFLARDPVAGTGMALTSGGWVAVGADRLLGGSGSDGLGIALIALAIALLAVPVVVAAMSSLIVSAVLALTAVRYLLAAVFALGGEPAIEDVAGAVGLAVTALALYASLALELESQEHGPALPLLRRTGSRETANGDLRTQLAGVEREAGVRRQI